MEKRIKVAFFIGVFPAISESWLVEQIITLIEAGVDIHIFSFKRGEEHHVSEKIRRYELLEKTTFLEFPSRRSRRFIAAPVLFMKMFAKNPAAALRLFTYGRSALKYLFWTAPLVGVLDRYEVIHCHFGMVANKFLVTRDILHPKQRFITTFYGQDSSRYIQAKGIGVYDKLKKECSYFLLMTEEMKERFSKLGFPPDRLVVHYTGVNPASYIFHLKKYDRKEQFNIVLVGRFVEKKGIDDALRALGEVLKRKKNVKLHIVGDGDPAYKDQLLHLIQELGIGEHVILEGLLPHDKTLALFGKMHLMVQPSKTAANGDTDDLPFVLLEAQMSGLPVLTTRHVGIPDGVSEGQSGFLVKEVDYQGVAEKVLFFMDNPDLLEQFSRHARAFTEGKFSIYGLNKRLIKLYHSLK